MNYVVTASPSTAVSHALVANLLHRDEPNLVVVKHNRVEVFALPLSPSPSPLLSFALQCRASSVFSLALPRPSLLLLSERHRACVLACDAHGAHTLSTRDIRDAMSASGDVQAIAAQAGAIVAAHAYTGQITWMSVGEGIEEIERQRIEEATVKDLAFIPHGAAPCLAVLHEDAHGKRHVSSYTLTGKRTIASGPVAVPNLDSTAHKLVPLPNGMLILCDDSIVYQPTRPVSRESEPVMTSAPSLLPPPLGAQLSCSTQHLHARAVCVLPGEPVRVVVADNAGGLHLVLVTERRITVEFLGTTSIASTLCYLGDGYLFVGSGLGDSVCVRLQSSPSPSGSFIPQAASFPSFAPALDLRVLPSSSGPSELLLACGAFQSGSLRSVRYGVALAEYASAPVQGARAVWQLAAQGEAERLLLIATAEETRVLELKGEGMQEDDSYPVTSAPTLLVQRIRLAGAPGIVHVSASAVTLYAPNLRDVKAQWVPPSGIITVGALATKTQQPCILVACGATLHLLSLSAPHVLTHLSALTLSHDVSSITIAPEQTEACVALWGDVKLQFVSLPALTLGPSLKLGETVVRELRYTRLAAAPALGELLCGLGDGSLLMFDRAAHAVVTESRRQFTLGSYALSILSLTDINEEDRGEEMQQEMSLPPHDGECLLICGDRPTLLSKRLSRPHFAPVNAPPLLSACLLPSASFPCALVLASLTSLVICRLDARSQLHARCVSARALVRRVCACGTEDAQRYAACTVRAEGDGERSEIRVWGAHTLEEGKGYALMPGEVASAIDTLDGYLVVGTALKRAEKELGRLLVFALDGLELSLRAERETEGPIYALSPVCGALAVCVNKEVQVFTLSPSLQLDKVCARRGFSLALALDVRGEILLVGDLMKSAAMLRYDASAKTLTEVARDLAPAWCVSVCMLDDERALVCEDSYNLYALRRNTGGVTEEERSRLDLIGEWHLGDQINRMRHGALVVGESSIPTVIMAGLSGAVYVLADLAQEKALADTLEKLQAAMYAYGQQHPQSPLGGLGGMRFDEWRAFENERRIAPARGFLDGDLIERFTELEVVIQEELAKQVGETPEQLARKIEELARALH